MRLTSIQPGDPTRTGAGLPSRGECTCSASRPWEACLPFAAAPRAPSLRAIPLCEKRCPLISWRRRRCPLISGGAFFCIWAPKHLHPRHDPRNTDALLRRCPFARWLHQPDGPAAVAGQGQHGQPRPAQGPRQVAEPRRGELPRTAAERTVVHQPPWPADPGPDPLFRATGTR